MRQPSPEGSFQQRILLEMSMAREWSLGKARLQSFGNHMEHLGGTAPTPGPPCHPAMAPRTAMRAEQIQHAPLSPHLYITSP